MMGNSFGRQPATPQFANNMHPKAAARYVDEQFRTLGPRNKVAKTIELIRNSDPISKFEMPPAFDPKSTVIEASGPNYINYLQKNSSVLESQPSDEVVLVEDAPTLYVSDLPNSELKSQVVKEQSLEIKQGLELIQAVDTRFVTGENKVFVKDESVAMEKGAKYLDSHTGEEVFEIKFEDGDMWINFFDPNGIPVLQFTGDELSKAKAQIADTANKREELWKN